MTGSNMRTPLAKVRGLGSAKAGTEHFMHQRLTAIANIPLIIFMVIFVVMHVDVSRAEMLADIGHPLVALMLVFTIISVCWHMKLGMQVIIEDYIHAEGPKVAALVANALFCVAIALTGLFAILKISFGG